MYRSAANSRSGHHSVADEAIKDFSPSRRLAMESDVRQEFRRVHGIDVQQPGWAGWFRAEVRRWILAEMEARRHVPWCGLPVVGADNQITGYSKTHEIPSPGPSPSGASLATNVPTSLNDALDQGNLW